MTHNITKRDNVFSVRDAGWHGLAKVWDDYPTREEAQQFAHNWEPVTEPLFRRVPVVTADGTLSEEYIEVQGYNLKVRSDNGDDLGVTTDTYEPVLNSTLYDIAEAIEGNDPKSVRYETGGSLKGGRKVWLLLRLAEPILIKGDPNGATIPYYALQNAHDGSGAFRGQALNTRIICDNTAQAADYESQARGTEFVFAHTKNIQQRIEEAKIALAGWRHSIKEWKQLSEHFVDLAVTDEQVAAFLDQFIPLPAANIVSERVRNNIEVARGDFLGVLNGPTCEGIDRTVYGLVQASIEYSQHYRRANTAETRFKRAYLDRSELTASAVKLAQEAVLA